MMTQAYYPGEGYDPFYRQPYRSASSAGHYERAAPYGYHDRPRVHMHAHYGDRYPARTMIHEQELESGTGGARKRIGVAVGSKEVTMPGGLEAFPQTTYAASAHPGNAYSNDSNSLPSYSQNVHLHAQPSLPTLHTRSSWMDNYDQYENSPVDAYTYSSASMPRQDSYASSYGGIDSYRSWNTTAPASAPLPALAQSSYYDQLPSSYTFGNLQAPSYTAGQVTRLPSVTIDSLSMGSLHSSLPIQTAQERRLPVPYTIQYPAPHSSSQIPQVRPLGSYSEPRAPTHGIHSRHAMPWSTDSTAGTARTASISTHNPTGGLPSLQYTQPQQPYITIPPISEPAFGYQVSQTHDPPTTSSPEVSPTTLPARSGNLPSTTTGMLPLPPASANVYNQTTFFPNCTMTATTSGPSSTYETMPAISQNLYSFSADERPTAASSDADHDDEGGVTASSTTSSLSSQVSAGHLQAYTNANLNAANADTNMRHPPPQSNLEGLRRRDGTEQRRAAGTTQRISVSNLSAARY
ncbi:hypothetical protein LTR86_007075 [Recurvomyces mirabilis]|nr:hypothetical protein LTR86_007075 [Recurvomyces mirabilis]